MTSKLFFVFTAAWLSLCVCAIAQTPRLEVTPDTTPPWQTVEADHTPTLTAPAADAPNIDGTLDDACWNSAPKIDTFARLRSLPDEAAKWVSVQASHDEQHLYLAARLAKPGATLRTAIKDIGGRVWLDDALEIFIHDQRRGVRYQIDVNALGVWWAGSAATWNPQIRSAATIDEQGWALELALPWQAMQFESPDDRPLGIQLRYLVNGQSGSASWVNTDPDQTDGYGQLAIAAKSETAGAPDRNLRVLRYFQREALPPGAAPGAVGVEFFNPTDQPLAGQVRLIRVNYIATPRLRTGPDAVTDGITTIDIPAGARRIATVDGTMPPTDPHVIRQTLDVRRADVASRRPVERLFQKTRDVGTLPDFQMTLQRERFRYGDKDVAGELVVGLPEDALASASLHVEFGTRRRILSEMNFESIDARQFKLSLNLADLEPDEYQLVAVLRAGEREFERIMPIAIERAMALPQRRQIPIHVDLPQGMDGTKSVPLYAGVSFPGGTLLDADHVRVVDDRGVELPAQIEALAHWGPQGSIRWAGVHFIAAPGGRSFFVEFGSDVKRQPVDGINLKRTADAIRIDTGAATFDVPFAGPLLGDAWLGGHQALVGGAPCLVVEDQNGRIATELGGEADEAPRVETEGPLLTVIRREGLLRRDDGSTLGKYIVRLFFHAGMSYVRVQHSFVNTEDTMQTQYRDIALRVKPAIEGPWHVRLDHSPQPDDDAFDVELDPHRGDAAYMAQTDYHHHRLGEPRYTIGYRSGGEWRDAEAGEACGQWVSASGKTVGVAMTLRNFVETFPSELEVGPDGVTAHLWSSRGGRDLDYRPSTLVDYYGRDWFDHSSRRGSSEWKSGADGMAALRNSAAGSARTHDLSIHLFAGEAEQRDVHHLAHVTHNPPLALQDPAWLRATEAMGPLHPYDPQRFPRAERFIESFFDYHLVGQAEHWGNYGFLDHGTGPHGFDTGSYDYRELPYPLLKRTFHFDYKFRSTPWRMYARSGDRMYFAYGDAKNRHIADFRWVHHPARGLRRGAMILSQVAYNLPLHWAGHETLAFQGQDIDNFIYQYYLTGDRWVHETVQEFGQYMIDHFDPRTTRPVGDMYNYQPYMFLASLYEMTWDEKIGDKLRAMRWTLDPDTTTGFMDWPSMSAWYKWYVELFGPLRDYMVTGSHEARDTFLKLAYLHINHAPADHTNVDTMGYDDNFGLAMNLAWRMTGDDRFAAHGRDLFNRRLFWFSHESGQTHLVGPYRSAHTAQGLDTFAFLMDLLSHMPQDTPRYPAVPIPGDAANVDVYFIKNYNHAARLDLVYGDGFDVLLTQLLDPGDKIKRLGSLELNMRPTYTAKDPNAGLGAGFAELVIPKEAMPAQYRMVNVREVDWVEHIDKIVAVAPEGMALPADSAEPASWYFMIHAGKKGAIHVDLPVTLDRGGESRELAADAWHTLEGGAEDQLVRITPARRAFEPLPFKENRGYTLLSREVKEAVFVQFRGDIPPVLAPHDGDRYFIPARAWKGTP